MTSRTANRNTGRKRTGIIGYMANIADDTRDFVDDMLDRGRDVDRDLRSAARRAIRDDDDVEEDDGLPALREDLDRLTEKLDRLAGEQSSQGQSKKAS